MEQSGVGARKARHPSPVPKCWHHTSVWQNISCPQCVFAGPKSCFRFSSWFYFVLHHDDDSFAALDAFTHICRRLLHVYNCSRLLTWAWIPSSHPCPHWCCHQSDFAPLWILDVLSSDTKMELEVNDGLGLCWTPRRQLPGPHGSLPPPVCVWWNMRSEHGAAESAE